MPRELTGAEALMGFHGRLTSRDVPVTFSSRHNATLAIELLDAFSHVNNIGAIGPDWPEGLTHPEPRSTTNDAHESFETHLTRLINHHSLEHHADTPDFLLARYLVRCLDVYHAAIVDREVWYGRGGGSEPAMALGAPERTMPCP
jgi:hypothetical protein